MRFLPAHPRTGATAPWGWTEAKEILKANGNGGVQLQDVLDVHGSKTGSESQSIPSTVHHPPPFTTSNIIGTGGTTKVGASAERLRSKYPQKQMPNATLPLPGGLCRLREFCPVAEVPTPARRIRPSQWDITRPTPAEHCVRALSRIEKKQKKKRVLESWENRIQRVKAKDY
ncbi:hypothetical protein HZH66_006422 [Vespula vulgaris]|uniref:Uncharacterized protein n=1 Tax=Vespula vulgaris TaxID=7454 RepID=A0A834N7G2_VESVU|nr:hypothetical protein HZH66_006422 [Vespula vulgaris]